VNCFIQHLEDKDKLEPLGYEGQAEQHAAQEEQAKKAAHAAARRPTKAVGASHHCRSRACWAGSSNTAAGVAGCGWWYQQVSWSCIDIHE